MYPFGKLYELPKLLFDLQTYEGKYNNVKNVHFLSGNLITDVNLILDKFPTVLEV